MDSSGLPIPIGRSEPLSAVLLQLCSQGLKLTSVPMSNKTRKYSLKHEKGLALKEFHENGDQAIIDCSISSDDQPNENQENTGLSPLVLQKNQDSSKHSLLREKHRSLAVLDQKECISTAAEALEVQMLSSVSPMTTWAQMNLVHQIENRRTDNKKLYGIEEQDIVPPERSRSCSEYEPKSGVQRLNRFVSELRNRPKENSIEFWKKLVGDFFAPTAKKRWCVSQYKKHKQIDSFFSKVVWQCDLCNVKPSCGFEISGEPLPRLYKIKYDTGLLEEHLQIDDAPSEHQDESGRIYVHYRKAVEETEYEQVRIVRYGQLCVVFSPDLKICSWDFCARNHEEFIRRNSISSQVHQLEAATKNYLLSSQDVSSVPSGEWRKSSDLFVSSANQMVDALTMPFISEIGILKRFVRCLQISEVLHIMSDLILYSRENGIRPTECMAKFLECGCTMSLSGPNSDQRPEEQYSPPEPSLPPQCSSFASAATGTGFCSNEFGSPGFYTSKGSNNRKRQHDDHSSRYAGTPAQITALGFSAILSKSNFPSPASSSPLLSNQPEGVHSRHGKLREKSTAKKIHLESQMSKLLQQDCLSNVAYPITPPGTANEITQGLMAAQSCNIAENVNEIILPSSEAIGVKSTGGNSSAPEGVVYIDVEKYEVKNGTIGFAAPNSETTPSIFVDRNVFPRDAKSKYLAAEFDDHLLDEFVDFDGLYELLK